MTTGSVLDILIYVFDRYMLDEAPEVPQRERLARDLEQAGFARAKVERALDWLTELAFEQMHSPQAQTPQQGMRVFTDSELARLSTECRDVVLRLERARVLSSAQREIVIERMLALDTDEPRHRAAQVGGAHGAVQPARRAGAGGGTAGQCAALTRARQARSDVVRGSSADFRFRHTHFSHAQHMAENLVIVESPAKAKTIKKYLGPGFEVLASYGHVRDLVPKEGAVDPDNGYAMKYRLLEKNEKHVAAIARALVKAKSLILATDPDREGEAIAWHLKEILRERGELTGKTVQRVVFYEITRNAVREAVSQPRALSLELVNAQQARRALDYLVGFNLSPLLWKKVRQGLSAGRVQSPALRMICEREEEISAFLAQEYWTIEGEGLHTSQGFPLKLLEYRGTKVEQFSFTNEAQAREAEQTLNAAAGGAGTSPGTLNVLAIDRKQRRRNPAPPFTTSTLQQEAARKLGFNARRTMRLRAAAAVRRGSRHRRRQRGSDHLHAHRFASDARRGGSARGSAEVAARLYGAQEVAEEPRIYKTKSKNAQEAHEAIRPTSAAITAQGKTSRKARSKTTCIAFMP